MNILHISRTMGQGGAEKVVVDLCENTREKFDNIVVLSTGGVHIKKLKEDGIHHEIIPDLESKSIKDIIITIKIMCNVIKKYNIDIVHSHHRMGAFYAQILKIIHKRIRLIYTAHNVFSNKRILTKLSLLRTEIVAVGEGVKKNLEEFYNIKSTNIQVINNSIKYIENNVGSIPDEFDKNKIVISCIGRLSEQKGIEYLIKSIGKLIEKYETRDILLLIIGNGEKKDELISLTKELKLEHYIKFLGYKSNVQDYMKYSRFIVSASLWEGFPLTPIECFSQGKTVIATDIIGNNEIIEDGYNGILFKPKDIDGLATIIHRLSEDQSLLLELEKNAKDTYFSKFSFDDYINKYIRFYSK